MKASSTLQNIRASVVSRSNGKDAIDKNQVRK